MATHYDLSGDLTQSDLIWLTGWPLADARVCQLLVLRPVPDPGAERAGDADPRPADR